MKFTAVIAGVHNGHRPTIGDMALRWALWKLGLGYLVVVLCALSGYLVVYAIHPTALIPVRSWLFVNLGVPLDF